MPVSSLAREASQHDESAADEPETHDAARAAAANVAESSFGHEATKSTPAAASGGKRALIQYDYEKAEDNELQLREGEYVTNIEMVDEDWWMGENSQGETGLFPSNYVELVEDDGGAPAASAPTHVAAPAEHEAGAAQQPEGKTATALYDYEAAEDNELSFPEGATITNVVCLATESFCLLKEGSLLISLLIGIPRRRLVVWRVQWPCRPLSCKLCRASPIGGQLVYNPCHSVYELYKISLPATWRLKMAKSTSTSMNKSKI
jgi:hypothetical protein